jgi:hypothetical protein
MREMTAFTITKKGQEISFESKFDSLDDAKDYLANNIKYNDFVSDLLSKKKVSVKQIAWMHYLATQDVIDSETPAEDGDYLKLVNMMYNAVQNNVRKLQVRLPGITLSTVNKGVNIGCVYVYENNQYVAKITTSGFLMGNVSDDVKNLLEDANDNLLQLAKIYGHESGSCSICGRKLDNPLSVQMGIGPICAKRFG